MGEPRYTEKEMVMVKREAFLDGSRWNETEHRNAGCRHSVSTAERRVAAALNYPLPKVERPRVVTDSEGDDWRYVGFQLEMRSRFTDWKEARGGNISEASRELVADLLAHPSEFVDDEG